MYLIETSVTTTSLYFTVVNILSLCSVCYCLRSGEVFDGFKYRWALRDHSDTTDRTGLGAPAWVDPDAQEYIIPFSVLCNPAHSCKDYRLRVIFSSTDYRFSVVTSYLLNERDMASRSDSITAYTRELLRAEHVYGSGASMALQTDFAHFRLIATTFLQDLPAVLLCHAILNMYNPIILYI